MKRHQSEGGLLQFRLINLKRLLYSVIQKSAFPAHKTPRLPNMAQGVLISYAASRFYFTLGLIGQPSEEIRLIYCEF